MTVAAERFGVYVHVPFCRHRCDYCAFATWTDRSDLASRYLDACIAQIDSDLGDAPNPTSVFVGGGTPSLVDPEHLARLIMGLRVARGAEVTVECNPDDVSSTWIETLLSAGVNRLSIGVQSFDRGVLGELGRTHHPENVARAAQAAREQGLAFNLDLIYGTFGESVSQWEATVREAIALGPSHISAYALTVEAGTPLADRPDRHPDDDDQATKYALVDRLLTSAGYEWYEISNWARPGHRCEHNLTYWLGGDYAAIGCAAHGYRNGRRYWNLYTPDRFVDAIEHRQDPTAGSETLDAEARNTERNALLIRTGAGVPIEAFEPSALAELEGLVREVDSVPPHWGVGSDRRLVLTERGRLLANEVAIRLR